MKSAPGQIIHESKKITVIATLKSLNSKTGNMVQIWIIRKDVSPLDASRTGADSAICGACPHRWNKGGMCYVNLGQAPTSIYESYKRGNYTRGGDHSIFAGRAVRFGAYGDPVKIPLHIVKSIAQVCNGWTGYTHQWKNKSAQAYKKYFMASVDTPAEALQAMAAGWRYFRVIKRNEPRPAHVLPEMECLNTSRGLNCIDCKLCGGASQAIKSITINAHGSRAGK